MYEADYTNIAAVTTNLKKMPASLQQRAESEDSAHLAIEGLPAIEFNSYLPTVACDIM
jgi:hypothetical protein